MGSLEKAQEGASAVASSSNSKQQATEAPVTGFSAYIKDRSRASEMATPLRGPAASFLPRNTTTTPLKVAEPPQPFPAGLEDTVKMLVIKVEELSMELGRVKEDHRQEMALLRKQSEEMSLQFHEALAKTKAALMEEIAAVDSGAMVGLQLASLELVTLGQRQKQQTASLTDLGQLVKGELNAVKQGVDERLQQDARLPRQLTEMFTSLIIDSREALIAKLSPPPTAFPPPQAPQQQPWPSFVPAQAAPFLFVSNAGPSISASQPFIAPPSSSLAAPPPVKLTPIVAASSVPATPSPSPFRATQSPSEIFGALAAAQQRAAPITPTADAKAKAKVSGPSTPDPCHAADESTRTVTPTPSSKPQSLDALSRSDRPLFSTPPQSPSPLPLLPAATVTGVQGRVAAIERRTSQESAITATENGPSNSSASTSSRTPPLLGKEAKGVATVDLKGKENMPLEEHERSRDMDFSDSEEEEDAAETEKEKEEPSVPPAPAPVTIASPSEREIISFALRSRPNGGANAFKPADWAGKTFNFSSPSPVKDMDFATIHRHKKLKDQHAQLRRKG